MSKSITRCPKCHTAFRVTDTHLNSAKGAVRCGSCLNIFNAKDFLVDSPTHTTPTPKNTQTIARATKQTADKNTNSNVDRKTKSAKPKTHPKQEPKKEVKTHLKTDTKTALSTNSKQKNIPANKVQNKQSDDDDLLISDDLDFHDEDDQDDFSSFDENTITSKNPVISSDFNLFERTKLPEDDETENSDTDESWALDLLRDDKSVKLSDEPEKKPTTFRKSPTGRFSAFELIDTEEKKEEAESTQTIPKTTTEKIRVDTSNQPKHTDADDEYFDEPFNYEDMDEAIDDSSYYTDPQYSSSKNQYIDAIEPEPVEFSWIKHGGNIWHSNIFWFTLSTLALVLAIGQFAYFKFDQLSRIEPYRSYYQKSCALLGCQLPALVDLTKIRTVNLVIRSHPNTSGELLVDAVLQNDAQFDQAFPSLDLIFTDINNQPVAAKRFKPSEYLSGELAGRKTMPSRQPIHIALQIEDPGKAAINYQMTISQAKN